MNLNTIKQLIYTYILYYTTIYNVLVLIIIIGEEYQYKSFLYIKRLEISSFHCCMESVDLPSSQTMKLNYLPNIASIVFKLWYIYTWVKIYIKGESSEYRTRRYNSSVVLLLLSCYYAITKILHFHHNSL